MSGETPPPQAGQAVRRRLSRSERHDLILEHAITVFGTRGYHNVSMDDIAEHAGISKALVYQHFESKDDLYMAVINSFMQELGEKVLPAWAQDLPPSERFWRGFVAFFDFIDENRKAWGVLYRDAVEIDDALVKGIHTLNAEMAEHIAAVFEAELANREVSPLLHQYARVAGHAVVGACHALADYWLDHPEETRLRMASTAMAVLWQGFDQLIERGEPWLPTPEMLKDL
ncbi:MAG: TetR/AcrR family transcriptional regulator [Actinobacteria bacterium]|nr:TetR/AcrR family transcriptional regulator [Actinomycetota bacterium]